MAIAKCPECSSPVSTYAKACPNCGFPLSGTALVATGGERSKTTAALFALLLGGFGAHKFYLGKPTIGILYLVFFWTMIPAFLGLIEGLRYLSMSQEDFADRYE